MSHFDQAAGPNPRVPASEPVRSQAAPEPVAQAGDDLSALRRTLLLYGTAGNPVRSGGAMSS
jgi:hypothetical protein